MLKKQRNKFLKTNSNERLISTFVCPNKVLSLNQCVANGNYVMFSISGLQTHSAIHNLAAIVIPLTYLP